MDCPKKEALQNYIDGELPDEQVHQISEHIRTCDSCKAELRELLSVLHIMNKAVDNAPCPSLDILQKYADDKCSREEKQNIAEHIELCDRCRSYVWAFQAPEQELADWQEREEAEYRDYLVQESASTLSKTILETLLPARVELFDKAWQSVVDFVNNLKGKAIESWPSLGGGSRLAEALGFAEAHDSQTDAMFVIMATTLAVSQSISGEKVKPTREELETTIKDVSTKFGAGGELQKRMVEILPPLVLKSQLDTDA